MQRIYFALVCLLIGVGSTNTEEAKYFIYGNECFPSKDGNPPVCRLVGWPANSPDASLWTQ